MAVVVVAGWAIGWVITVGVRAGDCRFVESTTTASTVRVCPGLIGIRTSHTGWLRSCPVVAGKAVPSTVTRAAWAPTGP